MMDQIIPFDSRCRTVKLKSGATYYCRHNTKPANRTELWACLKVGSTFEAESERGIAHLIEHLAFRGTRASPEKFALVRELEEHGCAFGAHQNAYTSLDETVFTLHIPSTSGNNGDSLDLVKKGLQILQQLSLEVRLSDEDVEHERPIVEEEWRASRGAAQRGSEAYFGLLCEGSLYAERLPIGKMEVIRTISPQEVRDFYEKHYHPHRLAVIAVGDFGGDEGLQEVEDHIAHVFEEVGLGRPPPPEREPIAIPIKSQPRVKIFSDFETTSSSLVIEIRQPKQQLIHVGDFRKTLVEDLFHHSLGLRLRKLSLATNPPFLSASTEPSNPVGDLFTVRLAVTCKDTQVMRAMTAVMTEVERIKMFGFSEGELEKAKKDMTTKTTRMWLEREQADSSSFCEEYKAHFLQAMASPGIEWQAEVEPQMLETITVDEVSSIARQQYNWGGDAVTHITMSHMGFFSRAQRFVSQFVGPGGGDDDDDGEVPEGRFLELLQQPPQVTDNGSQLEMEGQPTDFRDLLPSDLKPGSVVSKKHYPSGTCELTLSNGMEVTYLATDYQDDEIMFAAFAHGGLSELGEDFLPEGKLSLFLAEELGIFGVAPDMVQDLLSGCLVSLAPDIDAYSRGFSGECSSRDLATQLQVIHQFIACDQELMWDQNRVTHAMSWIREGIIAGQRDPGSVFESELERINTLNHPFMSPPTLQMLSKLNLPQCASYFRKLFSDPSHFRLLCVGNVQPKDFEELCERYLANIPIPSQSQSVPKLARTQVRPLRVSFPQRLVKKTIRMPMLERQAGATIALSFPLCLGGPRSPTHEARLRESLILGLANRVLERRLIEVLRFDRGSIYNSEF
jgi:predicted Zn-dependent peptidase